MSIYIRPKVTGATVFFTVCLADRSSTLLVDHIAVLREAVRDTRAKHPFQIIEWVTLPDHIHCIWRMPDGDREYGKRWGSIKSKFSRTVLRSRGWPKDRLVGFNPTLHPDRRVGFQPTIPVRSKSKQTKGNVMFGNAAFGNTTSAMIATLPITSNISTQTPSNTGLWIIQPIGHIPASTAPSASANPSGRRVGFHPTEGCGWFGGLVG